ncbi:DUF2075 domain-containing protein [Lactococcus raffinolactis]|uniref:DNA/RNA helicase domain-containing protein n=1 Tax=Pseudolactococcus raffinolactis TaxID=1366 RepID=UPI00289188FF|nr:DNA/RNA helicase domain-containing protein [Lactococcus raffinolactis]MDT2765491.1 DUF2075 domain-containing protein [Lactococcus raffinolactis]MDT2788358.1 DUF2075 domain-containing protein [Lactococcus raffinolactis]
MKVNNLRVFDNTLEGQTLLNYLKVQGLSLKSDKEENREKEEKKLLEEMLCLKQLVESLLSEDSEVDLSYFIIGFNIPQINNEFDLLRFGRNFDLNIELKDMNTGPKIVKQLTKQRQYLGIRGKELWQFSYVKDENQLYETDGENLIKSDFTRLLEVLRSQETELVDLDKLFEPSQFLISPFNTSDKFLEDSYFLNLQQDEIKRKIIKSEDKYHVVTGTAGSGKTLLVYDIAKEYLEAKKKVVIIHAGNLNDGQDFLNNHNWDIRPAKKHISEDEDIDILIVDESQRHRWHQFENILNLEKEMCIEKIVLCGDDNQILALKEENDNISNKTGGIRWFKKEKPIFKRYKLTGKVRTNKMVADFIKGLFDLKDMGTVDRNIINISYFDDKESVYKYVQYLDDKEESIFLDYTLPPRGGKYGNPLFQDFLDIRDITLYSGSHTSHEVIGQEFDNVTVCLGPHFLYRQNKLIFPNDQTNYYSASKMFFQNITRARKKINLIIFDNKPLLEKILGAIQ